MLHGERVTLRPVRREELPAVHAWRIDVDYWLLSDQGPYLPPSYEDFEKQWADPPPGLPFAGFGIEAEGRLVGLCRLWGIDLHNRFSHVGVSIGDKEHRGQGLGRDALAVITDYGFRLRGLQRLEVETLASNEAMIRTALSVGYREEGRLRARAFISGRFVDEVLFGLLAEEWHGKGA